MQSKPNPPSGIRRGILIGVLVLSAGALLASVASLSGALLLWMIPAAGKERAGAFTPGAMAACLIVTGVVGVVFFGHVMRQLVRAIRGVETARLAPRWVLVPAAYVMAAIGVGILAAGAHVEGARMTFTAVGACVLLLAYAFRELRAGARTKPTVATDPQCIGLRGDSDRLRREKGTILIAPRTQPTKRDPVIWIVPLLLLDLLPIMYDSVTRAEPTSLTCDRAMDRCELMHGWVIHRREELRAQDLISAEVTWGWQTTLKGERLRVYWVRLITNDGPRKLGAATPGEDEKLAIASTIKAFTNDPSAPSLQVRQPAWKSIYVGTGILVGMWVLAGLASLMRWLRKRKQD